MIEALVASHGEQLRDSCSLGWRNVSDVPDITQEVYFAHVAVPNVESIRSPERICLPCSGRGAATHAEDGELRRELTQVLNTHSATATRIRRRSWSPRSVSINSKSPQNSRPSRAAVFILSRRDGLSFDEIAVR